MNVSRDEFIDDLKAFGYSKSPRSKNIYTYSLAPDIHFGVKKRIVRLESRAVKDVGRAGWKRVRSYSIKRELSLATQVAELVVMSVGQED